MAARCLSRRRESGAAAVEFALVSLLLITLLFGILQYGFYFWSRSAANAAVREGARRVSVGDYADCAALKAFVQSEVGAAGAGNTVTTTRSIDKHPDNLLLTTEVGDIMTLKITFQAFDVGLIPLPLGGQVQSAAVSRIENIKSPAPGACP